MPSFRDLGGNRVIHAGYGRTFSELLQFLDEHLVAQSLDLQDTLLRPRLAGYGQQDVAGHGLERLPPTLALASAVALVAMDAVGRSSASLAAPLVIVLGAS